MTHYHNTHSTPRVSGASPLAYLYFYTLLDALAFILGVVFGAFALGYCMSVYFFG